MRTLRLVLVALLWLTPSLSPAQQPVAPKSATVYFYRLREGYAAVLKPSVFLDDKQVARMRNGRFVAAQYPAGSHKITSTLPGNGVVIDMKPGETYYLKLEMTRPTFAHNSRGSVTLIAAEQGKFEVAQLKPVEPEDLKDDPNPDSPKP